MSKERPNCDRISVYHQCCVRFIHASCKIKKTAFFPLLLSLNQSVCYSFYIQGVNLCTWENPLQCHSWFCENSTSHLRWEFGWGMLLWCRTDYFLPLLYFYMFCCLAFLASVNKCQWISMELMDSLGAISYRKGPPQCLKLTEVTRFFSKGSFK